MKVNKLEEAVSDYELALKKNLGDSNLVWYAYFHKGVCFFKLGKLDEAITDLKMTVETQSDK
jgi:tetratricopeptide (TPR) repeat protein